MKLMRSIFSGAILLAGVAGLGGPALAQNDGKPPPDPLAQAAYAILEKHCSRCHQADKLAPGRRPSKGIGNILELEQIANDQNLIQPGNPNASVVIKLMLDGKMPYDVFQEFDTSHPEPTKEEIEIVSKWITSLAVDPWQPCGGREYISKDVVVQAIAADLGTLSDTRARGTRYLSLASIWNSCAKEDAMNIYRQGAVKMLNSVARTSTVVRFEPIGPGGVLIRFNLDDLGWTAADWDLVLATYPYRVRPDNKQMAVLEQTTKSILPYVRADWFAFAASQAPLYDQLLKLPKTFGELIVLEGVDIDGDIEKGIAKRAGFQKSGVSQHNRLIERHPSRSGYFWTSYDFAGSKEIQSLFVHPLGPKGNDPFHHDGGESIWSLPNGFQAYYLNTSDGKQLQKGPTTIVRDESRPDFAVTNALSCFGCHDAGIKQATDELRPHVLAGRVFPKDVKDAVAELYPEKPVMDGILREDAERFRQAMARAGLDPSLRYNGAEPITALVKWFENNVGPRTVAAELGLPVELFHKSLGDASTASRIHVKRLEAGNTLPRDAYESVYAKLVEDFTDDKFLPAPAVAGAKPEDVKAIVAEVPKPAPRLEFDLSVTSDKPAYKVGDYPVFTIVSQKDCFLTLRNVDSAGVTTVLLPNAFFKNTFIKAGVPVFFPFSGAQFEYMMSSPGTELVEAICTVDNIPIDGIKHDFTRSAFTTAPQTQAALTRKIEIVTAREQVKREAAKVFEGVSGKPVKVDTARNAIKVVVAK